MAQSIGAADARTTNGPVAHSSALVLDPDPGFRSALGAALGEEGLHATKVSSVTRALDLVDRGAFAVVILGLGTLGDDEVELLSEVRAKAPGSHVIVVSPAASEDERIRGLRAGADDYLAKPVSVPELMARVGSALRHRPLRAGSFGEPEAAGASGVVQFSGVALDLEARSLVVLGHPVTLTRREFDLLAYLVRHPGHTFTREQLLAAVWASSADWQSETTVTEHVRRLRAKLEADPSHPRWIVTVQGVGYRFAAI